MSEPTQQDVTRLIEAKDGVTRIVAIKFDDQQITGTRYRYRINESAESQESEE